MIDLSDYDEVVRVIFPLIVVRDRLTAAMLDRDIVLILPTNVLPDAQRVYGLNVVHADVPKPMLGLGPFS
ncbi:MAG TPA: hypothetical protein VIJ31_10600 [Acidothermaceae bacterium]